ncbi:uncharacterized protein Dvir_GJ16869 [Drosophila virilis]|uniref:Uncharacterized protein n=1 Tax=Drosophila virilis TaxID=7244 RepID=B4M6W8_DROVI|nr:uncharacterized protein Dvir_GJ16869 [Drosophila virilis]
MSSSHSGTIGRKRVGSGSAVGSEFYYGSVSGSNAGSTAGGEQLRRQRSAEWHSHRHGHGYGSSSEDEYQNTAQATAFDTQLLAQLLLQSQQLASMEHYNSDCEPEYLRKRDRRSEDASQAEVTYAQPHQRPAAKAAPAAQSPLKLATVSASTGKYPSNANLGLFPNSSSSSSTLTPVANAASRSTNPFLNAKYTAEEAPLDATVGGAAAAAATAVAYLLPASASSSTAASSSRSHRSGAARNTLNRLSGMTSSSSGTSALSLSELHGAGSDLDEFAGSSGESEPPPEPAPPEIPPRTQSLLMSLRKHSDYKLKYEEKGDQKHEEFIPTSQLQKDYIISDNLRSVEQQLRPISPGDSQG